MVTKVFCAIGDITPGGTLNGNAAETVVPKEKRRKLSEEAIYETKLRDSHRRPVRSGAGRRTQL